jgi:NAD+ kinase
MKFGIVGNSQKENFTDTVTQLIRKLDSSQIDYLIDREIATYLETTRDAVPLRRDGIALRDSVFSESDIIIALGGDGTILRYARIAAIHNKSILGVNLGKLGFLAEVSIEELSDCIDEIIRGDYVVSTRLTIDCAIQGKRDKDSFGINDIVVDRGELLRVIDIETYVEADHLLTFKGDGLIISTPTGSTGYSLSCGGPIVAPDTDVLIITPISPHTLNARPVIIPAEKIIRIAVHSPEHIIQIATDGHLQQRLTTPVELTIARSDKRILLIKRKVRSYYDVLREKLMWGRDVRVNPVDNLP